jgi:hypothetical protein
MQQTTSQIAHKHRLEGREFRCITFAAPYIRNENPWKTTGMGLQKSIYGLDTLTVSYKRKERS